MAVPVRHPTRAAQSLDDKLKEIGARSPKDYAALVVLVDEVLKRLDAGAADPRRPGVDS
jgi:hypothetical protein